MCYLVRLESDGLLEVLVGEQSVRPFDHCEDLEEEFLYDGDYCEALWEPDGKYYEAQILEISGNQRHFMQ